MIPRFADGTKEMFLEAWEVCESWVFWRQGSLAAGSWSQKAFFLADQDIAVGQASSDTVFWEVNGSRFWGWPE